MSNHEAPERIWADDDGVWHGHDYGEIRPCAEYLRADIAASQLAEKEAALERVKRLKLLAEKKQSQAQGRLRKETERANELGADRDRLSAELAEARKRTEKMHRRAQEGERVTDALKSSMALWDEVANDKRGQTDQFNYGMRFAIREIRLDVERALRRSFLASKEARDGR